VFLEEKKLKIMKTSRFDFLFNGVLLNLTHDSVLSKCDDKKMETIKFSGHHQMPFGLLKKINFLLQKTRDYDIFLLYLNGTNNNSGTTM
jgi:hypothetical protein